jgi:hypothetical protein
VYYGLDIRQAAPEDWVIQWCTECSKAQVVVNFLSDAYIRSDSCAEEWSFSKSSPLRNKDATIVNLLVGGRDARQKLMAVPLVEMAEKGGMKIHNHFVTGGQATSVYAEDDIAEKILAAVMPNSDEGDAAARRQQTLDDARRQKEEAAVLLEAQTAALEDERLAVMGERVDNAQRKVSALEQAGIQSAAELAAAEGVTAGLGRTVASYCRASASYRIREHIRRLSF